MKKNITIILLIFLFAGIWGYFQPSLFPPKEYGLLFIVTSFIGGMIIGGVGSYFSNKY